jgi:hypothetical protein
MTLAERWLTVLAFTVTASCAADAWAQSIPNCGGAATDNSIVQLPLNDRAVRAIGTTSRSPSGCAAKLRVEIWVENTSGGAGWAEDAWAATDAITRYTSYYGWAVSTSKHWWIWLAPESWAYLGMRQASTYVQPPVSGGPPEEGGSDNQNCSGPEGPAECGSPIIVDTAGDGYRLTDVEHGVLFDLDGDGQPERVAWTHAGSDDAFLAMDRNGNGRIDDGSELFGNYTPAYADRRTPNAENGFVALNFLEGPGYGASRADGMLDRRDAAFGRLLLWRDANHNGISEPEELQPVSQTALRAISTDAKSSRRRDRHGNEFRLRAKSWWARADGQLEERFVYDVWLRTDKEALTMTNPE